MSEEKQKQPSDEDGIMVFRNDRYYAGLWYFELPPELSNFSRGGNFFGMLWRPLDTIDEGWTFVYRFRHYRDDRIFDNNDEFHRYMVTINDRKTEAEVLEKFQGFMQSIALAGGNRVLTYIEVKGNAEEVMKKIDGLPMFHKKTMPLPK